MHPDDITTFLMSVRALIDRGDVEFTGKASNELERMGWSEEDALSVIEALAAPAFHQVEQGARDNVDVWTFCPEADDFTLWVRLLLDGDCVVISFHPAREFG